MNILNRNNMFNVHFRIIFRENETMNIDKDNQSSGYVRTPIPDVSHPEIVELPGITSCCKTPRNATIAEHREISELSYDQLAKLHFPEGRSVREAIRIAKA
jgi:hypothetical protein